MVYFHADLATMAIQKHTPPIMMLIIVKVLVDVNGVYKKRARAYTLTLSEELTTADYDALIALLALLNRLTPSVFTAWNGVLSTVPMP